jgi:glycosyltransferase involved in cell wall biosynthesis
MNDIELWGLRSKILQKEFETIYGKDKKTFICYSGVPEQYISQNIVRDFSNRTNNFIFIGQLIERKYPSQLLHAIKEVFPEKNYHISFVGGGYKEEEILSTAKLLDIIDNVTLIGKTSRDQIIHYLDISDIFIMISRDEVFGLVYLEAMARGCITIGSRNEGIDGVIEHGTNGFLCEAGNSEELSAILKHINSLSKEELIKISQNAIQTAKEMTDYKVAEKYINTVFEQ